MEQRSTIPWADRLERRHEIQSETETSKQGPANPPLRRVPNDENCLRLGLFGRGRLAQAIAAEAGPAIAWMVSSTDLSPADQMPEVDVLLAVGKGESVVEILDWALQWELPIVIGSTGWTCADLHERVGSRIGVVLAPNFSLAVAFLARLAFAFGRFAHLFPDFQPGIHEQHQGRKRDAPSGTARLLAERLVAANPRLLGWSMAGTGTAIPDYQLCVSSLRAGPGPNRHVLSLTASDEMLELSHMAFNARTYAAGALRACQFIRGKKGVFGFHEVAGEVLDPIFEGVHP
jgi:4-hydroxy-tetrahydrodipicolinate reductase